MVLLEKSNNFVFVVVFFKKPFKKLMLSIKSINRNDKCNPGANQTTIHPVSNSETEQLKTKEY